MIWYYLGWNVRTNKLCCQSETHLCTGHLWCREGRARDLLLASCSAPPCSRGPQKRLLASQASTSPPGIILLQADLLVTGSGVRIYGTISPKFFKTLQRKIPWKNKQNKTLNYRQRKKTLPGIFFHSGNSYGKLELEMLSDFKIRSSEFFFASTSPQKKNCRWNQCFHVKESSHQRPCFKIQVEIKTKEAGAASSVAKAPNITVRSFWYSLMLPGALTNMGVGKLYLCYLLFF